MGADTIGAADAKGQEIAISLPDLAREVHRHWRAARLAGGWTFGAYNSARKSSPYLKPYSEFSDAELRREHWLAFGDVMGIAAAAQALRADFAIDRLALVGGVRALLLARDDDPRLLVAARFVHEAWRAANAHFGARPDDPRNSSSFDGLVAQDRQTTLSNLRADLAALSSFFARLQSEAPLLRLAPDASFTAAPQMRRRRGYVGGRLLRPEPRRVR